MATASAKARAWIDQLDSGEFFFPSEVPGPRAAVYPLLSRLAADPDHPVQREQKGLYTKMWSDREPRRRRISDRVRGAFKLAGEGGGGASLFALNRFGWSWQIPSRYDFAVLGKPPTSPWPKIVFLQRSNQRRRSLRVGEVSLMEAIRFYGRIDSRPWSEVIDGIESGLMHRRAQLAPSRLRPDMIEWAFEGERNLSVPCRRRAADVCAALHRFETAR